MRQAQIIDGKKIAENLRDGIAESVKELQEKHNITPTLAVILVGEDPASQVYVKNKAIATKKAGMKSLEYKLPATISEEELCKKIDTLNHDEEIDGILVQFPVPAHISQERIMSMISPDKDVDGLNPLNVGRLASGLEALTPCTPFGCILLAKQVMEDLTGKTALIIGRSNLVGKPLIQLLLNENATVTIAHSRTNNLPDLCKEADIVFAAVGRAHFVKGEWLKAEAVVIDVGINRIDAPEDNRTRLVGDVDFNAALNIASYITPVPGGVGPMTIACLLRNTLKATTQRRGLCVSI